MDVQLRVILGKAKGQVLSFPKGKFVFGRGPECHVRADSPMLSRQHCLLNIRNDEVWLRDLGSAHGTLVNDNLVQQERRLQHGDLVQLGPLILEVLLDSPPAGATLSGTDALSGTASDDE